MWQGYTRLLALLLGLAAVAASAAEPVGSRLDPYGQPLPRFATDRIVSQEYFVGWQLTALALSRDGKRLATAGIVTDDMPRAVRWDPYQPLYAVRLRNPRTGDVLRTLHSAAECPTALCFSPAGDVLAVASGQTIVLLSVESGKDIRSWETSGGRIVCLCYSPDGKYLASSGDRGRMNVWEAATGTFEMQRRFHVRQIAFSDDSTCVTAACNDGAVRIWSMDSGVELQRFRAAPANVRFAFLSDGKRMAVVNDKTIDVYHLKSGLPMPSVELPEDVGVPTAFTADGQRLLCIDGGAIDVLDTASGKRNKTLFEKERAGRDEAATKESDRPLSQLDLVDDWLRHNDVRTSVSAQGNLLAVRDATNFRIADLETGKVASYPVFGPVPRKLLCLSPNGSQLLTVDRGAMRLWDTCSQTEIAQLKLPPIAHAWPSRDWRRDRCLFAFSPNGRLVAGVDALNGRNKIHVWEAFPGRFVRTLKCTDTITALAFHADGKHVVATTRSYVEAWDLNSGRRVVPVEQMLTTPEMRLSPDGRLAMFVGNFGRWLLFYDTLTGRLARVLEPADHIKGGLIDFSPDGKKLLYLTSGTKLAVYDIGSDRKEQRTTLAQPLALTIAMSPDGKLLAGMTTLGTICVMDVATGKERTQLAGHRFAITRLQFTPNGESLISCGSEGTILFWNLRAALAAAKPAADAPCGDQ